MSNKMLIIGARGMVGQQAVQYFSKEFDVIALSKMDLSVTDMSEIKRIFDRLKPYIVLNCSVIRNDRCLIDTQLAREVNAEGVRNLAIQCQKSNAVLVQLSTDYVFEGNIGGTYTEEVCPCPVSIYGRTKREGEKFALEENDKTFVIRTGWLYGKYGDNFVHKILHQILLKQEIRIIGDQYGSPTSVDELLNMTYRLVKTTSYGIYHAVCSGKSSRLAFAQQIIKRMGFDNNIYKIHNSRGMVFDTSLSNEKLCRVIQYRPLHWTQALEIYLNKIIT